ncbi:hypothetical protein [Streptomyces sp. ActVer]|nr:hypothetical protein [Streptomyces sp. ActVer]
MCDACGKRLSAHCKHCQCCNPREVEHPDTCPVQQRRERQRR